MTETEVQAIVKAVLAAMPSHSSPRDEEHQRVTARLTQLKAYVQEKRKVTLEAAAEHLGVTADAARHYARSLAAVGELHVVLKYKLPKTSRLRAISAGTVLYSKDAVIFE